MMRGIAASLLAILLASQPAMADTDADTITVGVLTDLTGPFSAWSGDGSVTAARMAVEDFRTSHGTFRKIEVISADFKLRPDVAVSVARQWLSQGVNAIVDVPQSGAALAINDLLRGSSAVFLASGAQHDDLTTTECSPNTAQWTFDSSSLTRTTVSELERRGVSAWFFLVADFAGGKSMMNAAVAAVKAAGGKTVGSVLTPINTTDFSSFLIQAANSGADAVAVIEGGADLVNALKAASEFGMNTPGWTIAATFAQLSDVKSLGLDVAQGLLFTEAFYWDLDDPKRDFARRFAARNQGRYPTSVQAGAYSAVLHYLAAVDQSQSTSGPAVVAQMKEMPVADHLFGPGSVRADGRMVHDMYLVRVKTPSAARGDWDLYDIVRRVPGGEAFRPLSDACQLSAHSK